MIQKAVAVGLLVVALAGCSTVVRMRHADGRVRECGGHSEFGWARMLANPEREGQCIRDYQRQGFERE